MTTRWHVAEAVQGKEISAARWASDALKFQFEIPAHTEIIPHRFRITSKIALRFPGYLFLQFAFQAPWKLLYSDEAKQAGFIRLLCDNADKPVPVPSDAMQAMRAYTPEERHSDRAALVPGQAVLAYLVPGYSQRAMFLGYGKGGRAKVRLWIMGHEAEITVPASALVPKQGWAA